MKASVYLKEAKGNGKQGVSCICFRVRDKEIDIKVASGLQVVDKYWDGDALRYRRNAIVDKDEQKWKRRARLTLLGTRDCPLWAK